jgi:hypothetical protein
MRKVKYVIMCEKRIVIEETGMDKKRKDFV